MAEIRPIEQTVFEQAPQATFVPPAQQPQVYQEDKVVFVEPIYSVDPGIAWYALGAEAANTASTLFKNTLDYLIESKGNAVEELRDKYQSELTSLYNKQTAALYEKDPTKRASAQQTVATISDQIDSLRQKFKDESVKALETDSYFADDFNIKEYGIAYQRLALKARGSLRDFDERSSRLLYDSQRVANGLMKEKNNFGLWKNSDIGDRPKDLGPQVLQGSYPVPTQDGIPVVGFNTTESGTPTIPLTANINGQEVPVVSRNESDGNWYLNPEALEALPHDQLELLYKIDQTTYGDESGVVSAGGQPTAFFEDALKQTAQQPQLNAGMSGYVGVSLANLPDHVAEKTIDSLSGLGDDDKLMLSMIRSHFVNGGRKEGLANIVSLNRETLKRNTSLIQKMRSNPTIAGVANIPQDVDKYQEFATLLTDISQQYGLNVEDGALAYDKTRYDLVDPEGVTAAALLQDNPVLMYALARVSTMLDSNPAVYGNDEELKKQTMQKLFKEVINREGYFVTQNQNTGTPIVVYSRGLKHITLARENLQTNQRRLEGLPELAEVIKEDGTQADAVIANSYLFETEWAGNRFGGSLKAFAIDTAKRLNPQVDVEVFESLLDAAITEGRDTRTGVRHQQGLPFGQLLRMVVASSPVAMEQTGRVIIEGRTSVPFTERINAAYEVWKDTDFTDGSDNAIIEYDINPSTYAFMGSPNGGIPLRIRQLKGASGRDYFPAVVSDSQRNFGAFSPKLDDNTPMMFLGTEKNEATKKRLDLNIDKYLDSKRKKPVVAFVDYSKETPPNKSALNADDVITATTVGYMPTEFKPTVNAGQPLVSFEQAEKFRILNASPIRTAAEQDPELKNVVPLLYEVAKDRNGTATYEENKVLFSQANLKKLYDKAVAQGAKTNEDYVAFIFEAMRTYSVNNQKDFGRQITLEQATKSSSSDFLGKEGTDKGIILYSSSSPKFFDGVSTYLSQGYNLYSKGNKYFMFSPSELSPESAKSKGYKLEDTSDFEILKRKKDKVEQVKELFFWSNKDTTKERQKDFQQLILQGMSPVSPEIDTRVYPSMQMK